MNKKTRKRQKHPLTWKKNITKQLVNSGNEHVSTNGKIIKAKKINIENVCKENCTFKCSLNFSISNIKDIHSLYYSLSRKDKLSYLINYSERVECFKSKKNRYSFRYYFPKHDLPKIRVCKVFFLNSLSISQKVVYNVHENKNPLSLTPPDEKRGKKLDNRISRERKDFVFKHISSYPTIQSHYCRADSQRKYLDSNLNISKMYNQYVTLCLSQNETPVKSHMYRSIFNNNFNLSFYSPKKDLCEVCVEYDYLKKSNSHDTQKTNFYEEHILKKDSMRLERNADKNINPNTIVVCFDLENVINLPMTNVGCAFYKRKLNVYNMTAHVNVSSGVYCAIWNEALVGRSGNDLASAVIFILTKIVEDIDNIEHIITWSDSCVPQNRNSIISTAMINFLLNNPKIKTITMKYSIPGHSCIQEVDNAHSQIEKKIKNLEIWSPLGFIRALLTVNEKKPFKILQLNENTFKNYHFTSKQFKFNLIPFNSVVQLQFSNININIVKYKTLHGVDDFIQINLCSNSTPNFIQSLKNINLAVSTKNNPKITKEKIQDVEYLYKFMPEDERTFYTNLFHRYKETFT